MESIEFKYKCIELAETNQDVIIKILNKKNKYLVDCFNNERSNKTFENHFLSTRYWRQCSKVVNDTEIIRRFECNNIFITIASDTKDKKITFISTFN